jgi:LacI family transcriptional regulator
VTTPRRPSIRRVAQIAGVSTATVSRVLNESGTVSDAVAARVREAVAELGYSPNALTQGIFGSATSTIGVLIRDLRSPFYLELMRGIQEVAASDGSLVMFANTFDKTDVEQDQIRAMDAQRVRGLIVTTGPETDPMTAKMAAQGTPCVIVTREPAVHVPRLHSIRLDNRHAGLLLGEHLVRHRRTHVGVIAGGSEETIKARVSGLRQELTAQGISLDDAKIITCDDPQDVREAVKHLIQPQASRPAVNAVVCTSGRLTVGVYAALSLLGLHVPTDIGLISMDDSPWAEALNLTVVDQPAYEMGRLAAQLIIDGSEGHTNTVFKPKLISRISV